MLGPFPHALLVSHLHSNSVLPSSLKMKLPSLTKLLLRASQARTFRAKFRAQTRIEKKLLDFSANNGLFALLSTKNNFTTTRSFLVIVD